jgi:hypothetical protein
VESHQVIQVTQDKEDVKVKLVDLQELVIRLEDEHN